MSTDRFEILFTKWQRDRGRTYRLQAEVVFRNEESVRFRIWAGAKEMIMEKFLEKKTGQWKIRQKNFQLGENLQDAAVAILEIQNKLDEFLKQEGEEE